MERMEFLKKARQYAEEQITDSSSLPDMEWKEILAAIADGSSEETLLREKAKQILSDATEDFDIE